MQADLRRSYSVERKKARKMIAREPLYREYWKLPPGSMGRLVAVAMWRALDDAWDACKVAAIETAAGL